MKVSVKPWQIAVVEDDDGLRSAILRMLTTCGWNSVGFPAAENLLRSPVLHGLDCLVLDLYLPGISGFDFLDEIKVRGLHIPTILITAQDDEKIRLRVQETDALFLPKPFSGQLLATTVLECMKKADADLITTKRGSR
ncbi:response regulator transcription factor [Glaciimonas soli]|uniref:Response regulator n=1 Tax=Glaciimonas soli TaxID=2590999 RepID=A0A843YTH6_9BURK|nr:response regulator [Glaciimonas soli]MQR01004.1 response regulator [Glaciimonas soli]